MSGLLGSPAWDLVNGDTAGAQTTMQGTIAQSMNMILSLVGMNLNQFVAVWQADFSLAQMILQTVWNNIMAFLKTGLVGWQATWSLFQQIISAVWHGMENTINAVMGQVRDNINGFLQFLRDALSTALSVAAAIANIATGGGGTPSHAAGGIAPAGQAAMFGEQGPEMAVPLTDMLVFPAAVTSQIMNMPQTNASNTTNWNYAPTYYSAPPQPSVDFAIMQVMAA